MYGGKFWFESGSNSRRNHRYPKQETETGIIKNPMPILLDAWIEIQCCKEQSC